MNALVIYDSLYGNTKKIAQAIGKELGKNVSVSHIKDVNKEDLKKVELLIVGSPTHGGRPTPAMVEFLNSIPDGSLKGKKVAAFDTEMSPDGKGFFLKAILKIFGFAARHIKESLVEDGGVEIIPSQGFIVEGKTGPLIKGELEKAKEWAKNIHI